MDSTLARLAAMDGVEVTELRQIVDARGAVLHMLRADAPEAGAIGEVYFSEVAPRAVKAWKRHRLQTQRLAVPAGRVRLAVYDDRVADAGAGLAVVELGRPEAYVRVVIAPHLWYGFACVGDDPALIVNCPDRPHDPGEGETRPVDDPAFPDCW